MRNLLVLLVIAIIFGCSKVPISGRRQVSLIPEKQLITMSQSQYATFLSTANVIQNTDQARLVEKVGLNISNAVNMYMQNHRKLNRIKGFAKSKAGNVSTKAHRQHLTLMIEKALEN